MSTQPIRLTASPTKPNLKPRLALFFIALSLFLAWGVALLWLYFRAARG